MYLIFHEAMCLQQISTGSETTGKSMRVLHTFSHVRVATVQALQHGPSLNDLC